MKALVYHGPGRKAWEEVPDPTLQDPTDVIAKVDTTTICGTDLHILKGDVPAVTEGRILGHEGVGTVTEVGSAVSTVKVGDRVIISCISACGACSYCHQGLYAHCLADEGASGIGWIFGHLIDGTQAELVRVPFADNSVYKLPEGVSDEAVHRPQTIVRVAESLRRIHDGPAIPGLFEPVRRDGHLLVDGGVTDNLPVDAARQLGAGETERRDGR